VALFSSAIPNQFDQFAAEIVVWAKDFILILATAPAKRPYLGMEKDSARFGASAADVLPATVIRDRLILGQLLLILYVNGDHSDVLERRLLRAEASLLNRTGLDI
tara:strand:- start:313 stop:627 length:315 start_codon:yes stop_codon:yes gene_type:complete